MRRKYYERQQFRKYSDTQLAEAKTEPKREWTPNECFCCSASAGCVNRQKCLLVYYEVSVSGMSFLGKISWYI